MPEAEYTSTDPPTQVAVEVVPPEGEDPAITDLRVAEAHSHAWSGLDDDERRVVIRGEITLAQMRRRGMSEWLLIGQAVELLQAEVMRQTGATNTRGRRYNTGWAQLGGCPALC